MNYPNTTSPDTGDVHQRDTVPARSYWLELLGAEVRYLQGRYRTRVIEAGAGHPLLLLHGTGGHAENYIRNIMPLARHFHVYAIDFLWHGKSQSTGFSAEVVPPLVDQVKDVLDVLGLERAHIEGQSLGGWIAMRFALEHPDRLDRLVLTTPMGYVPDSGSVPGYTEPDMSLLRASSMEVLRNPTTANIHARLARILADPSILTDEAVAVRQALYSDPEINAVQQQLIPNYLGGEAIKKYFVTDELAAGVAAPTLVYWGDKNISPPAVGERLAQSIPDSKFICAPATGHWAQYESAELHNTEVTRFLRDGLETI
ncbi:MAG: alpha/beta hydrolase [Burkholderiaceae bacterium]|nr:alpha/beta hydrolase [Burkholderiaceae bacterium]